MRARSKWVAKWLAFTLLLGACGHTLVTSAGDRISFVMRGQGPTIVVLAGGPGPHAPLYDAAFAPLERFARVIYWDYAGTGRSLAPTRATLNDDLEDLDALVLTHGGHAFLLAHSYGTMVAVRYAALHPERVAGLILTGAHESARDFAVADKIKSERLGADFARYRSLGQRCFGDGGCSPDDARAFLRLDARTDLHDVTRADALAQQLPFDPAAGRARAGDIAVYDARLLTVAAPALVVEGADDPGLAGARALAAKLHAELVVLEASGHYPFVEEPARFVAAVEKFVSARARTTTEAQVSPNAPVTKPAVP